MRRFSRKHILGISLLLAAIGFLFLIRSSTFASVQRLTRGAYYAASNGHEQFLFTGNVKATTKGKVAMDLSIRSLMKENQIILFIGQLIVKGKVTPNTPGTAIPSKLRLAAIHKNANGNPIGTTTFDVDVQSNGTILVQNFPFATFDLINPKETLDLTVTPVDKNLPASSVSLNVLHSIGSSAAVKAMQETPKEDMNSTALPKFTFVFNNYLSGHPKNEIIGPLLLRVPTDLQYFSEGTMHVKGKISPLDPGGLPNRFQVILKYKVQQNGPVLTTVLYNVNVAANGLIPLQNFPVSGNAVAASPSYVEISMKYLDKNIPDRIVNVSLSFSPTPSAP